MRLYEVKKGFAKADLVDLITPSPHRRAAPCGRAVDTTRLVSDLGYTPTFTTLAAVEDYVSRRGQARAARAAA